MVQLNGLEGNVGQAIPLYQKGFNWIKFLVGFLFGCCLCLLFTTAVTFLTLYILAQTGVISSTRTTISGRMMPTKPANDLIMNKKLLDNYVFDEKQSTVALNQIDNQITIVPIRTYKSKYNRLKSRRNA